MEPFTVYHLISLQRRHALTVKDPLLGHRASASLTCPQHSLQQSRPINAHLDQVGLTCSTTQLSKYRYGRTDTVAMMQLDKDYATKWESAVLEHCDSLGTVKGY